MVGGEKSDAVPSIFGVTDSNKDFGAPESWGKNLFNNAFPIGLANLFKARNMPAVLITTQTSGGRPQFLPEDAPIEEIYGTQVPLNRLRFDFESGYPPDAQLLAPDETHQNDVVVSEVHGNSDVKPVRALEIKLTVVPDSSSADRENQADWGPELVLRPPTATAIALRLATRFARGDDALVALRDFIHESVQPMTADNQTGPRYRSKQKDRNNAHHGGYRLAVSAMESQT